LRQRVLRGGMVMAAVSVAMRGSSVIAQLILGRVLIDEEFGLYALALGFVTVGSALRSVLRPVLIEATANEPSEVQRIFSNTMWAVIAFAVVGIGLTPLIGRLVDEPDLPPLLVLLLILMPLQLLSSPGVAKINEAMQFSVFGRVVAVAGLLRHAITVIAALAGLGAYSFVVGAFAATLIEVVAVRRIAGPFPALSTPRRRPEAALTSPLNLGGDPGKRWIWPTAIALALALSGDYLGASIFASTALLGVYFFAYQLTGALFEPMNLAANTVLVPAFVKISDEETRRSSFITTVKTLSVFGTLFFMAASVGVAPLTNWLWGGRWDDAIFAIIAFAVYAPIRLIHPSTQSIARGCGMWSLFATDMIAVGVVTFLSALIGAAIGGLSTLVLFVVGGHFLVTLSAVVRVGHRLGSPLVSVVSSLLGPWLTGLAGLGIAHVLTDGIDSTDWTGLPVRVLIVAAALVVGLLIPHRNLIRTTVGSMVNR
jgi:O-antigen/teichoic acid export membrane protein